MPRTFWEVPGDLDYDSKTETEPECWVEPDYSFREAWRVHINLPRLGSYGLIVQATPGAPRIELYHVESDGLKLMFKDAVDA